MSKTRYGWLIAVALFAAFSFVNLASAAEKQEKRWVYKGNGVWELQLIAEPPLPEQLQKAQQALSSNPRLARQLSLDFVLANPRHKQRDEGLFIHAQARYLNGERLEAFYYCDELLDLHPDSRKFRDALQLQYQIADDWFNGTPVWYFIFPGDASSVAIDAMFRIQQRAPGSVLAEKALLRTADYYFATEDYDLARDAYAAYQKQFPRSPLIPKVRLRRAYSSLALFNGLLYDATPLIDARTQFQEIQSDYPAMAKKEKIGEVLERIEATLANKLLESGNYFARTGQFRGAAYYYKYLMVSYPDSEYAKAASARLQTLPESARNDPTPVPGDGFAPFGAGPSTQPALE